MIVENLGPLRPCLGQPVCRHHPQRLEDDLGMVNALVRIVVVDEEGGLRRPEAG